MKRVVAAVASVILVTVLTGATAAPTVALSSAAPQTGAPQAPANPVPEDPTDSIRAAEYWLGQYGVREAWKTTRGAG